MGLATYTYNRSTSGGEIITHLINSTDGTGLHFDGSAGSIDIASPPNLGTKFSFEFIVQADSWGSTQYLSDFGPTAGAGRLSLASFSAESYNLAIYDTGYHSFGVAVLDDLKVHHLVVTIDGTAAILYDNGNQVGTTTIAAPTIDSAADATLGSYVAGGSNWDGTFYRARFWNKTLTAAEVTASYENASVPFADQYGSETVLISVATGLDGWDASNTWNSQTTGGSNMILSATALNEYCRTNVTLGVGKKYRLTYTATGTTTAYFGGFWGGGYTNIHQITDGTRSVEFTFEFAQPFINDYFYCYAGGATAAVTLSNLSLVEIGCAVDLDLAFANPTQSLMVQDRAGNADGTSSATGVVQVTPIEQLNAKALSIGTTAGTPADGELMIDGGGITYNAASTRFEIAKDLKMEGATGSKIYMRKAVGDTTSLLGELQFGNNNIDSNVAVIAAYQGGATDSGELRFFTEPAGGALTQRLTIDSVGALTSTVSGGYFETRSDGGGFNYKQTLDVATAGVSIKGQSNRGDLGQVRILQTATGADGGYITFDTCPVGSTTPAERMRIHSDGEAFVGTTDQGVCMHGNSSTIASIRALNAARNTYKNLEFNALTYDFQTSSSGRLNISSTGAVALGNSALAVSNGLIQLRGANAKEGIYINTGTDEDHTLLNLTGQGGGGELQWVKSNTSFNFTKGVTETNGVLRSNLLTNSGFDVWSNSTLENVGSELAINGGFDSDSGWTKGTGWSIGSGVATASSASGNLTSAASITFVAGKLYKLTFTVGGSVSGSLIAQVNGENRATVTSAATYTFVFESPDTSGTIDFIPTSFNGTLNDVTLFEVTPGTVAADTLACDGWYKTATSDMWRQHNDGGTYTKDGSFYAAKVTTTASWAGLNWPLSAVSTAGEWTQRFAGRTVTFGAWLKTSVASFARLIINDSGSQTVSTNHTGGGAWEWLEVTATIGASPTSVKVQVGDTSPTGTYYISQPMLVFGSAIGSGNYSRPSGEIVDFENSSNYLNSFATTAFSSTSGTPSLEAESNGKIPKGAKAVYLSAAIRDADSTGGGNCRIYLGKNSTSKYDLQISNDEVPDDQWRYNSGRVGCDSNGDIYYDIDATGSDTLDARIWPLAVQLR